MHQVELLGLKTPKRVMVVLVTLVILLVFLFVGDRVMRVGTRNILGLRIARVLVLQPNTEWLYTMSSGITQTQSIELAPSYWPNPGPVDYRDDQLLGLASAIGRNWQGAEAAFQHAASLQPNDPLAWFWLGMSEYVQGKSQSAVSAWSKADALPFLLTAGRSYMLTNRYQQAQEWYLMAFEVAKLSGIPSGSQGDIAQAYGDLGKIASDQGKIDQAIHYYEEALAYLPRRTLFHRDLALLYWTLGRYDDAEAHLQTLMQIEPESPDWPEMLGDVYLQAKQLDLAEQSYFQSLRLAGDSNALDRCRRARAWFGLSALYYQRQAWESSIEASLETVRVNQGLKPIWHYQLDLNFKGALAAQPDRIDWYLQIGDMYESVGDIQSAQEYFNAGAQHSPENTQLQDRLLHMPNNKAILTGACP